MGTSDYSLNCYLQGVVTPVKKNGASKPICPILLHPNPLGSACPRVEIQKTISIPLDARNNLVTESRII